MHNIHKKQWYIGVLVCVLTLCFTFGWIAVFQSVSAHEAADGWVVPITWFSLGISALCLAAFSVKDRMILVACALFAFIPAIFFVHDIRFILFLCVSVGLSFIGMTRIRSSMEWHIKIQVRRSLQHGTGLIALAFSFAIASFYYMQIRNASGEDLLQKLSLDHASHAMLTQSLGLINPDFKKVNQENVTVDEFLLAFQKNQTMDNDLTATIPSDDELLRMAGMKPSDPRATQTLIQIKNGLAESAVTINPKTLILEQSRKQLSDIAGRSLSGQEHIADVLSQVIDQRVRTYFQPSMVSGSTTVLPFVLSTILFLTLWSLGAFLAIAWRLMTAGAFALLRRLGSIEVKKIMVEQEVID